jgi:arsenate reductase (thioredoxin)
MERKPKVLFLSTGNCTRSEMAEGFLRKWSKGEFDAVSTATESSVVSPIAREVMDEVGVDISWQRPKNLKDSLKEHFAFVVSLCDARSERFPVFPFTRNLLRWSLEDPGAAEGSPEERRAAFRGVRDKIEVNVHDLVLRTLYPTLGDAVAHK